MAVLVIARFAAGTSLVAHACGTPPGPSSTHDWFRKWPFVMSSAVTVCVAVQVIVPPGGSEATGLLGRHASPVTSGSVTCTLVSVESPALVATIW